MYCSTIPPNEPRGSTVGQTKSLEYGAVENAFVGPSRSWLRLVMNQITGVALNSPSTSGASVAWRTGDGTPVKDHFTEIHPPPSSCGSREKLMGCERLAPCAWAGSGPLSLVRMHYRPGASVAPSTSELVSGVWSCDLVTRRPAAFWKCSPCGRNSRFTVGHPANRQVDTRRVRFGSAGRPIAAIVSALWDHVGRASLGMSQVVKPNTTPCVVLGSVRIVWASPSENRTPLASRYSLAAVRSLTCSVTA
jgi:hypothetical protein